MLEVIYNDCYSILTIVDIQNDEGFAVIDSNFNVYETLSYNPFTPTKEDLICLFEKSLHDYFDLDNKHKSIIGLSLRQKMFNQSLTQFKNWLKGHKELWG